MSHVRVDHEEIVAADARRPGLSRSAVNRHVLAKNIAVADFQARRLTVVFEVLRSFAEYGALVDGISGAHREGAAKIGVSANRALRANSNRPFDHHVRAHGYVVG